MPNTFAFCLSCCHIWMFSTYNQGHCTNHFPFHCLNSEILLLIYLHLSPHPIRSRRSFCNYFKFIHSKWMGWEWDHWWSRLSVSMPFSAIFRHYFICRRVSPLLCFLLWCTCVVGFHWDSFSEMLLMVQIAILLQRCRELWWIQIINQMRGKNVKGQRDGGVCLIMLHNPCLYTIMSV